jgi:hypothetical protein
MEGVTWYNRSREDAEGTRILREVRPDGSVLLYRYGVDGSVIGFTYNGASYYYGKNLFGDIVDIYVTNMFLNLTKIVRFLLYNEIGRDEWLSW